MSLRLFSEISVLFFTGEPSNIAEHRVHAKKLHELLSAHLLPQYAQCLLVLLCSTTVWFFSGDAVGSV